MKEKGIESANEDANRETFAIVFGDLVGLDGLTAQRGDLETNALRQQFFDRTRALIKGHGGEMVKIVGDGLLAVFPQVAQAVEFAIETQQALQNDPLGLQASQLKCRFGIHFASVRTKRTADSLNIFGWEVTYAARLLQLQQTTDFLISETAFQSLPPHMSAQFLKHRETQGSTPPDEPRVWNYRGILNEPKAEPVRADLPTNVGRYEIQSVLGEGGMGILYLARDKAVDLQVALKTLSSTSPKARRHFLEEAQAGRLDHQSIVKVYEVGEQGSIPYVAMEFVQGEPLDRLLASDRVPTLVEKLEIVVQVCDGLGYAHSKGIIHRDIKPANIMVQPNGRIKIIDFAAMQPTEEFNLTGVMQVMGTVHYVAPERLKDQDSGGRGDIWATGVMLYYMLTGEEPFPGKEPLSVMHKVLSESYPPLSLYLKDYPLAIDQILERALAKKPEDRYATAEEMARDLESVAEQLKKLRVGELAVQASTLVAQHLYEDAAGKTEQDRPASLLDQIVSQGRFGADPHPAKRATAPVFPSCPAPPTPLVPLRAVPISAPPPAVAKPGPLTKLLRSLTGFPGEPKPTIVERPPETEENKPSPPVKPDSSLSELIRKLEAPTERTADPKDPMRTVYSALLPAFNRYAPPSAMPPLAGGGIIELFRALDNPQQAAPQPPSVQPGALPSSPPVQPAGAGEFTEILNRTQLQEIMSDGSQPAPVPTPVLPPSMHPAFAQPSAVVSEATMPTASFTPTTSHSFQIDLSNIECASEAIVVIDIVQATATSDLFGWYAVGRVLIRELREYVREIGAKYEMCCIKSTGDGFLLTYRNEDSAEVAAIHAVKASRDLLTRLAIRNQRSPEQRKIAVRLALHFGEVDILPDDRLGPNISYAFRVLDAINAIDPDRFPLRDYIICSERVNEIVERHLPDWPRTSCGLFKLKGFTGWGELFLISEPADA